MKHRGMTIWCLGACLIGGSAGALIADQTAQEPRGVGLPGEVPGSVVTGDRANARGDEHVDRNDEQDEAAHGRGTEDRETILEVAINEYRAWLEKIPVGNEAAYGFRSRDEFEHAIVGPPIPMVTIEPGDLGRDGAIKHLGTFRVPILVNGSYRALLTVALTQDTYRVVDLGAGGLAGELGGLCANEKIIRADTDVYLLRIFQLRSDFLVVAPRGRRPEDGDFRPMRSARILLDLTIDAPAGEVAGGRRVGQDELQHHELVGVLRRNLDRPPAFGDRGVVR